MSSKYPIKMGVFDGFAGTFWDGKFAAGLLVLSTGAKINIPNCDSANRKSAEGKSFARFRAVDATFALNPFVSKRDAMRRNSLPQCLIVMCLPFPRFGFAQDASKIIDQLEKAEGVRRVRARFRRCNQDQ